ncbi:hypothetical protein DFH09DRAFT_1314276 [Mycena vulgaris]|nr:hypothetical protein DFH09DRAFT_1314276 [Mycena vulgaris]
MSVALHPSLDASSALSTPPHSSTFHAKRLGAAVVFAPMQMRDGCSTPLDSSIDEKWMRDEENHKKKDRKRTKAEIDMRSPLLP